MIAFSLEHIQAPGGGSVVYAPGWSFRMITVLTVTAGSMFVMWIGEQITERGIGNGISLIIMAGIVARLPSALSTTFQFVREGEMSMFVLIVILLIVVGVTAASSMSRPASGGFRFSTRGASSDGGSTAGRARTCRSR